MTDRSVKSYDGRFRRRWRLAITLLVLGLVGAAITWQTERVTKSVALTELRLILAETRRSGSNGGPLALKPEAHIDWDSVRRLRSAVSLRRLATRSGSAVPASVHRA